jgi:hypothetical protein
MSSYSPQQLLDQIHEIGIPELYEERMSEKERKARLKLAKQKLKAVKQRLRAEQTFVKGQYDGRNSGEAYLKRVELMPYELIDEVISRLEVQLTDLDTSLQLDNALPLAPIYGTLLVGGVAYGGYTISDQLGAAEWMIQRLDERIAAVPQAPAVWSFILGLLFFIVSSCVCLVTPRLDGSSMLILFVLAIASLWVMVNKTVKDSKRKQAIEPLLKERRRWQEIYTEANPLTQLKPKRSEAEKRSEVDEEADNDTLRVQFQAAKALIQSKQYSQARALLQTIDHPTAKEWLVKLNALEQREV